jgi:hypothetical protein
MSKFSFDKNENHPDMKAWLVTDEGGVIVSDHANRDEARQEAKRLNEYAEGKTAADAPAAQYVNPLNAHKNFHELALKFPEGSSAHRFWMTHADNAARQHVNS